MKRRIVTGPNGEVRFVTIDGDMIDAIAYAYYGQHSRNTEAIIEANPHLAEVGTVLPAGIVIRLPPAPRQDLPKPFRRLWD